MSYSASTIGLPVLRHSSSASMAAFWRIFSASLKRMRPRSCAVVVAHGPESNAALRGLHCAVRRRQHWRRGNLRDHFFGRRIVDGKRLRRIAVDPFAIDVNLIGRTSVFTPLDMNLLPNLQLCRAALGYAARVARATRFAFRPPYTKKKNAASPIKNSVPPNIQISYDHNERDLLRREKHQRDSQSRGQQAAHTGKNQRRLAVVPLPHRIARKQSSAARQTCTETESTAAPPQATAASETFPAPRTPTKFITTRTIETAACTISAAYGVAYFGCTFASHAGM